jgi:hypothetical protein
MECSSDAVEFSKGELTMAFKYGDAVALVQKSPAGSIRRVNAIVLSSATQPPNATRPNGLKDFKGALLAEGEYLDLAFPRDLGGQELKVSSLEAIFQKAYSVAPWKDGAWIGWQLGSATDVAPDPAPAQPGDSEKVRVIKGK